LHEKELYDRLAAFQCYLWTNTWFAS